MIYASIDHYNTIITSWHSVEALESTNEGLTFGLPDVKAWMNEQPPILPEVFRVML